MRTELLIRKLIEWHVLHPVLGVGFGSYRHLTVFVFETIILVQYKVP